MTHMYFSARAEGRISYGHLGRTNSCFVLTFMTSYPPAAIKWHNGEGDSESGNPAEKRAWEVSSSVRQGPTKQNLVLLSITEHFWWKNNATVFSLLWEGAVWDAMDRLGFISRLVANVAVASGFSAVTYWLAVSVVNGLAAPKPPSQAVDMETCISGSGRVSVSCRISISGTMPIPRPSSARDLVTMAEVGSTRLISLERVTTGVGSVSRGARAKPNLLGCSLRLPLPEGAVSMTLCPKLLLTDNRKMPGKFW